MLLGTIALGVALVSGDTAKAAPATWTIDPVHSELSFRVRHLNGRVRGAFKEWGGTVSVDPDQLIGGSVQVEGKTASVNTENERRDGHLRSPDFFDVEKYPTLSFRSTRVELQGSQVTLTGDLTIKDVTKPVVLKGTYNGRTKDPMGRERLGFEASTLIDRRDFGLVWNKMVEGVSFVGDDITIDVAIEAVRN